ncbi:MAG: membrane protein insertion efficiency factor YidD [Phycisphaerales bacterium]
MNFPFVALIKVYQVTLSPLVGRGCRFMPTCSNYGLDAYRAYGPLKATALTAWRILRCHPFSKGGYDPVPIPDCSDSARAPADRESRREKGE